MGLVLAVGGVPVGIAIATSGSGAVGTTLARGTGDLKIKTRGNQPYDAVVQRITIAPGGHTGWHTHPGNAIVVVKSGALTIYEGNDRRCAPDRYPAGSVYIDPGYGHVHIGRNLESTELELLVTYIDVPVGEPFRIDAPAPGNCA